MMFGQKEWKKLMTWHRVRYAQGALNHRSRLVMMAFTEPCTGLVEAEDDHEAEVVQEGLA